MMIMYSDDEAMVIMYKDDDRRLSYIEIKIDGDAVEGS